MPAPGSSRESGEALIYVTIGPIHSNLVGGIENAPPPRASTSGTHTEVAGRSPRSPASKARAAGKKPWSKPTILVVEDGVFLTESGPDYEFQQESFLYHPNS